MFCSLIDAHLRMLGNTQTLSITSDQDNPNLPSCALIPFFEGNMIECPTNNCFCRADVVQSAIEAVESYFVGNGFAVTGVTTLVLNQLGRWQWVYCPLCYQVHFQFFVRKL